MVLLPSVEYMDYHVIVLPGATRYPGLADYPYTALVLSKIYYKCAVYSSAKRSCLKKLDPLLTAGIRFATGAFRTNPARSYIVKQE